MKVKANLYLIDALEIYEIVALSSSLYTTQSFMQDYPSESDSEEPSFICQIHDKQTIRSSNNSGKGLNSGLPVIAKHKKANLSFL